LPARVGKGWSQVGGDEHAGGIEDDDDGIR
jgi:hypothetical protein